MSKKPIDPTTLGLPILSPKEADAKGYASLTTSISASYEQAILRAVCDGKSPDRCCLVDMGGDRYQLGLQSKYLSNLAAAPTRETGLFSAH